MLDTDLTGATSDAQAGPAQAGAYHVTNLLLHLANVLLLYALFFKMTRSKWRSAFVAAAFALHPLHVESVAWISERKDVLSTLFWLLTMLAYVLYTETRSRRWYVATAAAFALGLMAKPMLVSLPIVLLVMDYWPLGRLQVTGYRLQKPDTRHPTPNTRHLFLEKLPLVALAGASCAITYWVQETVGAVDPTHAYPFGVRLANAVVLPVSYLLKTFWPAGLAVYYPHPGPSLPVWEVVVCTAALAGVTALAVRARKSQPWLIAGWLWYLVTLLPVAGIVQVADHAMADRYTYVPLIGVFFAIAWSVPEMLVRGSARRSAALSAAAVLAIGALGVCSYIQAGCWRNSMTLFSHTLAATSPRNAVALFNLGIAYAQQGDDEEATRLYRAAIRAEPRHVGAHYNLGNSLARLNRPDEAWQEYLIALKLHPENSVVHHSMGYLLAQQGKIDQAIHEFKEAVRIDPHNVDARYNLEQLEAPRQQRQAPGVGARSGARE
jgi:hypothetical protein